MSRPKREPSPSHKHTARMTAPGAKHETREQRTRRLGDKKRQQDFGTCSHALMMASFLSNRSWTSSKCFANSGLSDWISWMRLSMETVRGVAAQDGGSGHAGTLTVLDTRVWPDRYRDLSI